MHHHQRRRACAAATGALTLLALPTLARAQAAAQTTPPSAPTGTNPAQQPTDNSPTVGEVVVTAQRRSESLQRAPVAVTALPAATLEKLNIATTQDLMQVTPSLQVATQTAGDSGGSATFFLRGLGQQRAGNGSEPAVGIYVDDFYYPSLQGTIFEIVGLQQVEVLRGPQGTLFGRNTIGGAIRYTTQKPTDDFNGYLLGTVGSYDRGDISGAVNIPLSPIAALRISGGHLGDDGFVRQQNGGKDAGGTTTDLGRIQLRLKPTSTVTIDTAFQYSRFHLDGFAYTQPGPITTPPGSLTFVFNRMPAGAANPFDSRYVSQCFYCQAGTNSREFSTSRTLFTSNVINWDLTANLSLKSLTSYIKVDSESYSDIDGTPVPIFNGSAVNDNHAVSQEFQFTGKLLDGHLDFVSGIYYYNDGQTGGRLANLPFITIGRVGANNVDSRETTSYAVYFDGTYHLTDKLSFIGGYRYSDDDKSARYTSPTGAALANASASFSSSTGRFGLQYQATRDIFSYATFSTGFRGGGFNLVTSPTNLYSSFQPENLTSYEGGLRMAFLDRRIHVNPTIFYTKYTDVQVQSAVPDPVAGAVLLTLQNAARAHSSGLELESDAQLTRNWSLFGNLATLNIQYDSIGAASGITVHSHFERAPRLTYSLGTSYKQPLPGGSDITGTIHWSHEGQQNSTPTDIDTLILPAYGILNARLEYTSADRHWNVAVFGTNLLDKRYSVGGENLTSNVGTFHYDVGRPLEGGVSVHNKF